MAFAYTKDIDTNIGSLRMTGGTFTSSGGGVGGDIKTGLNQILDFQIQHKAAAVVASAPVYNATLPLTGGAVVPIVTVADTVGRWKAFGY
jgi:hypothetical protein